ncbi:MAG: sugar transferase [Rhodospirillaceae bacterium]|nr:sugar transferase [Rhodospirillaceae bacterium]
MAKRLVDLAVAVAALVVLSPVFVLIALWVKADSPGTALFVQERIGRHGVPFKLFKFRTMHVNAGGPAVTVGGDSRVTAAGCILRRWKLDELPQLFNVLRGEMSLVGPRPEVARYVDLWDAAARAEILAARPGLTDPASIKYRDEEAMLAAHADPERAYREIVLPDKVRLYRDYVRTQTFLGDLKLLVATVAAVLRRP